MTLQLWQPHSTNAKSTEELIIQVNNYLKLMQAVHPKCSKCMSGSNL